MAHCSATLLPPATRAALATALAVAAISAAASDRPYFCLINIPVAMMQDAWDSGLIARMCNQGLFFH